MELEENHHFDLHARKRTRDSSNDGHVAKIRRKDNLDAGDGGEGKSSGIMAWQHNIPASRIYRVSRASGGKDRHSKVYTAKGLRDRRVRLSVSTAIQFYDLQDRLGYDQPSKAIEWLIKAAASSIDELPSLGSFMNPLHFEEEKNLQIVAQPESDPNYNQQQHLHVSPKSGCSSTSDTSKGSVLSLSRSESRVKARERARERVAKEKDKDDGSHADAVSHHQNTTPNLNSQTSFTELLTGGGGSSHGRTSGGNPRPGGIQKQISTADYFNQDGIFSQSQKNHQHLTSGFSSHSPFESSSAIAMIPFNIAAGDHSELQQFSILQDNIMPVSAMPTTTVGTTGDYNLNFTIASGLAGFNRGTLQSNSPSQFHQHNNHGHHLSHIQRLPSVEGSNLPFFFGAAVASAAPTSVNNQFPSVPPGFDGRLQVCYGNGFQHSDLKGKGKS